MDKHKELIKVEFNNAIEVYDILLGAGLSQEEIKKIMDAVVAAMVTEINNSYEDKYHWIKYKEPT